MHISQFNTDTDYIKNDNNFTDTIKAADKIAMYDECAKKLLAHKSILAHILIASIDDFKDLSPQEVAGLIEGNPMTGVIPVSPGLTNTPSDKMGEKIHGINSEDTEIHEGRIYFDIIFYVYLNNTLSKIIVNVEAQQKQPENYNIINRAVYYSCRLISSQKSRDFISSNYNDIKRVYSIWICMNMNDDSFAHIHLTADKLSGSCEWKGNLDLINIVMIGLRKENNNICGIDNDIGANDRYGSIIYLLKILFSKKLPPNYKLNIMNTKYNIPTETNLKEDMNTMCNLGEGIFEEGIEIGEAAGLKLGEIKIILNMHTKGFSIEQIAYASDKSIDEIKSIIEDSATKKES